MITDQEYVVTTTKGKLQVHYLKEKDTPNKNLYSASDDRGVNRPGHPIRSYVMPQIGRGEQNVQSGHEWT